MESNTSNFSATLKAVIVIVLIITAVILISLFGAYMSEKTAYIEANTSNIGSVINKFYDTVGASNRYKIEIERQTFNAAGEVVQKTEIYAISYEDYLQIEIGHVATYNEDGSIDIDPPVEGEAQPEYLPPEPFGLTFSQYLQREMTKMTEETIPDFFSSETNVILVAVVVVVLCAAVACIYHSREEIAARFDASATEQLSKFLRPYADNEEDIETCEDSEEWSEEYSEEPADEELRGPSRPNACGTNDCRTGLGRAPIPNQPEPNNVQEPRLTVRQIRSLVDNLSQIEITEGYITRASGYNSALTTAYDNLEVTRLSISSSYSPKLTIDITPKAF